MSNQSNKPVPVNYFLEPGYIFVATQPTVISGVLGSSVSVCIYDRKRKLGGMNLFQYPEVLEKHRATAVYGNAATIALIRMLVEDGSRMKHLEAQVFGGAHNKSVSPQNIGRENIMAAKRILNRQRIQIISEDVGGEKGRKIIYNTQTNDIAVMKVDRLRIGDWYPYESNR